jgi:RNA polymerase primary sigma factor
MASHSTETDDTSFQTALTRLTERGEEAGCIELSELNALAKSLGLDESDVDVLHDRLGQQGIEVLDDCARDGAGEGTYVNDGLASSTTDALRLFLNEISRYPLLTRDQEMELAKRIEQGDQEAKNRRGSPRGPAGHTRGGSGVGSPAWRTLRPVPSG